jgi:outer membrane protein OmpA-like peptidoglycan-associated protein
MYDAGLPQSVHALLDDAGNAYIVTPGVGTFDSSVGVATRAAGQPHFSDQSPLFALSGEDPGPAVAAGPRGEALVVAADGPNLRSAIIRSPQNGDWSVLPPLTQPGRTIVSLQVAFDGQGVATTIWIGKDANDSGLYTSSLPPGGNWSSPQLIDNLDVQPQPSDGSGTMAIVHPRLAVNGEGDATVVAEETQTDGNPPAVVGTEVVGYGRARNGSWKQILAPVGYPFGHPFRTPGPFSAPDVGIDDAGRSYVVMRWGSSMVAQSRTLDSDWGPLQPLGPAADTAIPKVAVTPHGRGGAVWASPDGTIEAALQDGTGPFQDSRAVSKPGKVSPYFTVDSAGDGVAVWTDPGGLFTGSVQGSGLDGAGPLLPDPFIPSTVTVNAIATFSVNASSDVWSPTNALPVWSFGDGSTADGYSVAHVYRSPGPYTVTVGQSDGVGNVTTKAGAISVVEGPCAPNCNPLIGLDSLSAAKAYPGDLLVLSGHGFGRAKDTSKVVVDGVRANIVSWSDSKIEAFLPTLDPGPAEVSVIADAGRSNALSLRVEPLPPQPPLPNPVITAAPGGAVTLDASLAVDPNGALAKAQPGEQGADSLGPAASALRARWTFGDGSPPSNRQNVTHRFPGPGTYKVRLTVSTPSGRRSSVVRPVVITRAARRTIVRVPPANVNIPSQIVFDFGSAALRPASRRYLERVGKVVRRAIRTTLVAGYTDNAGPAAYNQRLSLERAQTVSGFLVKRARVGRTRVRAIGYGERHPLASNRTVLGRQRNRRVVLTVHLPAGSSRI